MLDRSSIAALRPRLEHMAAGATAVLDSSDVQQIETTGVQLLCALVLGAEARGAVITWSHVSVALIKSVNLLGIGDVIQFDRADEDGELPD